MPSGFVEEGTFQAPPGHALPTAALPYKDRTGAVKVAAGLNLAWGGLLVLAAIVTGVVLTTLADQAANNGDHWAMEDILMARTIAVTTLAVVGLPYVVGGVAVFARQSWGRPLLFGVSGLGLFIPPFGTIASIVSFWALTRPGAEPWFGGAP